ncbi:MAG: putative CoA-binding protein [Vicingaceae bacterium]|jgi:predicted CoA-binding protein
MSFKKTLVLGASTNAYRYSNIAVKKLLSYGHEVVPIGIKLGSIKGVEIQIAGDNIEGIHTVTLYIGPKNQHQYFDYILNLNPSRVLFNPGTINGSFIKLLEENGIEVIEACTLVMLSANTY